jgi:hypothetical protein
LKKSKKVISNPPHVINGSRLLFYSLMPRTVGYSGKISILIGGKEVGRVPRLAIADSLREKGIYLLHCDKNWDLISLDGLFKSVTDAKRRAELMYPGVTRSWKKLTVSKREAMEIEKKIWKGQECSFCGRIPPEFERSLHSKSAQICNICVDQFYHRLLRMQEETSISPPRGDYYPENGFDHIASYISKLLASTSTKKSLIFGTLDRMRGCLLFAYGSMIQVSFILKVQQENTREPSIREFFKNKDKTPASDYLSEDRRFRILQYPLNGTAEELTAITKTILQELCAISAKEALTIKFDEE